MTPTRLELIGTEVALVWSDGTEQFISMEKLRAASPSAENTGQRDLLGKKIGGANQKHFPGVTVKDWRMVGGYSIQFEFSDGHNTGLYSFDYLRALDGVDAA